MMRPGGIHDPAAQSRARCWDPERRQTGSDFSPLSDAFHPSFPTSVEDYISAPGILIGEDFTHHRPDHNGDCLDGCLCHGNHIGHDAPRQLNNASMVAFSAAKDCASDAHHCYPESHGDNLLLGTSDTISNLPPEISDLILSYLSPAALDAVRHTCKDWRTRILSNTWILSSVLGVKENRSRLDGSLSGKLKHRDLLKQFDCDSDLPSTSQHSDAWRTRFRTRNLEFSVPSQLSTLSTPTFVAAARTGTQNGFLAFQLQNSAQSTRDHSKSTLVIYRFDSAELPWYAGTIHDVEGQGALRITSVAEIRRHAEWVLKIEIGCAAGLYSLSARECFSKSDSYFSLKVLESLEKAPGSSSDIFVIQELEKPPEPLLVGDQSWNALAPFSSNGGFRHVCFSQGVRKKPPESLLVGDQSWNALAPFPSNGGFRHVCFSQGVRKHTETRFLAEHRETGNIYVVMKVEPLQKPSQSPSYTHPCSQPKDPGSSHHHFTGTALLSRPRSNSIYRNVAVAATNIKDGSIRAVIIWQTTDLEEPISELYIYDIPEAIFYEPCRAYNQEPSKDVSAMADEGATPRPCRLVQGKRVTSLDQHIGGIHPSSPLFQLSTPQVIALGGLQFPHTTKYQETYPRDVQYQKCFVWGPATAEGECTQISFKIFDFSFADPQRLHSLVAYGLRAGQRRDQNSHNITLNLLHCACALHDDGFRIVLPDVTVAEASKPATNPDKTGKSASSWLQKTAGLKEMFAFNELAWSIWPRKSRSAQEGARNVGSISRNDSMARRAALERRQEWLRGRILGMKRVGLTDFEISELWNTSAWTQYGQVRKPEGWQKLGTVREGVYDYLMVA